MLSASSVRPATATMALALASRRPSECTTAGAADAPTEMTGVRAEFEWVTWAAIVGGAVRGRVVERRDESTPAPATAISATQTATTPPLASER